MVKENISVKFLIHLVGERPALWDKTSEDFRDRKLKETSWLEICAFVNENFYSLSNRERHEFYKMIMKKWTHIRDSWVKSMKYGFDEVTKLPSKPYIYHNELKFMQKILKCKPHRFDLNQCHPSNAHYEEFFRDANETQNSHETSQDVAEDEGGEEGQLEPKQESNISKTESNTCEAEESDEWQLEETEIVPEVEENEKDKNPERVKKKRSSIFVNSRSNADEYPEQKLSSRLMMQKVQSMPTPSKQPAQSLPNFPTIDNISSYRQCNNYNYIEQRHWSFFKGILPSVNGLDEDHTLQFQSGVISLLQKLRESQKLKYKPQRMSSHTLYKGRGRKRKASPEDDDDESPTSNNNFRRKQSLRQASDPIGPEYAGAQTDYSSDD